MTPEDKKSTTALVTVLLFILGIRIVSAAPVISVDLDPDLPGIQDTLTVPPSTTFTVGVVIEDDAQTATPTTFDTIILEAFYNDSGPILSKGPSLASGLATSGELAGNSPTTIDLFIPSIPAGPTLGVGPSSPSGGFASGTGAIGLADPSNFVIAPGSISTVFTVDFTASAPGTSEVRPAGTAPFGSPALALGGPPGIAATFESGTVIVTTDGLPEGALDVDGQGQSDALTDGIIILRFLFQFMGDPLIGGGVVDPSCQRCSADEIKAFLEGVPLDVDGNGAPDALTDGILILRFLFEFTGEALIKDAVGSGCMRCTAPAIEAFLASGVLP